MKIIELNQRELIYSGADAGFMKTVLLLFSIIYPVVTFFGITVILNGANMIVRIFSLVVLMLMTVAFFSFFNIYKRLKNETYKINKSNFTVETTVFNSKGIIQVGKFLHLEIRSYIIPGQGYVEYRLFLIGAKTEAKLGLKSYRKNSIIKKSQPVIDFLGLKLVFDEKVKPSYLY